MIAKFCGFAVALVSGYFMYFALWYNNLPLDSGERRGWVSLLETVLFAPTIWVTKPVHQALYLSGHFALIPWLTFAEIGLLTVFYGVLIHQAIMGKLTPQRIGGWLSRRRWLVGVVVGVMIITSVVGRVATARQDFRKEAPIDEAAFEAAPVVEESDVRVTVVETSTVAVPNGFEPVAAMRVRGEPVSVLVKGSVSQSDSSSFLSSKVDLVLLQLDGDHWIERKRFEGVALSGISDDFRPPSDPLSAGVLFLGNLPSDPRVMMPFSDSDVIVAFPPSVDSAAGFAEADSVWVVGLGYGWRQWDGPSVKRISAYDHPNFATYSIGVFQEKTAGGTVDLKGICESFTDHGIDTLDATIDGDGVLHIVGAEVLIANDNSLRMHHLRFDTRTSNWIGDEVCWESRAFTSSVHPLIRGSSQGIEMLWNLTRPSDEESGGVFACNSNERRVFRLTERENSFLAAIADPLPGLEMVVGRADPGYQPDRTPGLTREEQLTRSLTAIDDARKAARTAVEWYVKSGGEWFVAGTTNVPVLVHEPWAGQTGFWLWPGNDGHLFAAFLTQSAMIVQELSLVPVGESQN